MSNLQPVPRTDKHGRVVIRHMRQDDVSSGTRHSFPSPHGVSKKVTEAQSFAKKKAVNDHDLRIKEMLKKFDIGFWERRKLTKTLAPDAISSLVDHGIIHDDNNSHTAIPQNLIADCVRAKAFTLINDLAAYLNDGGEVTDNPDSFIYGKYESVAYLKGLGGSNDADPENNAFGFKPYSLASDEERAAQRAVIAAARTLDREFLIVDDYTDSVRTVGVKSHDLVEKIKENPDNVSDLVELINERRVEPTREQLENVDSLIATRAEITTPLMDGAL